MKEAELTGFNEAERKMCEEVRSIMIGEDEDRGNNRAWAWQKEAEHQEALETEKQKEAEHRAVHDQLEMDIWEYEQQRLEELSMDEYEASGYDSDGHYIPGEFRERRVRDQHHEWERQEDEMKKGMEI